MLELRWYQEEALAAMWQAICTPSAGNPLVVLQTGTGKSVIPAEFTKRLLAKWQNLRFINATHVEELVVGNYRAMRRQLPSVDAGIYHAGLKRKQYENQVIYGGIASLHKQPELFGHRDLMFIDEAHLLSDKNSSMYQKFIAALKKINPRLIVIGLTATPYRMGMGLLTDGEMFDSVCYDLSTLAGWDRLLAEGFLAPIVTKQTNQQFNLSGVRRIAGEYSQKDLTAAMGDREDILAAVDEIIYWGTLQNRKHWLVFANSVDNANKIRDLFRIRGVTAVALHGIKSKMEAGVTRQSAYAGFEDGTYKALVSVGMTTTGYDFPAIDLIGHLRATLSTALWVQMNGRGTRPCVGKTDCLALDFVGNTARLGPINDPVLPRKPGEKKDHPAPVKLCPECATILHASVPRCNQCGYEFPKGMPVLLKPADTRDVLKTNKPKVEVFKVMTTTYQQHKGRGTKPSSLRVTYHCGSRHFTEWVCLEHGGYPAKRARTWWAQRAQPGTDGVFIPSTVVDALIECDYLKKPSEIRVWTNKKIPEILAYRMDGVWLPN